MTFPIPDEVKNGLMRQMIKIIDIDKNNPRAEQIIREITSPDNNRIMNMIYFILSQETDIEKKQDDLSFSVHGGWFASIFEELKRRNRPFFSEFCQEVKKKIDEMRKTESKEYTVIFPLNFESNARVPFYNRWPHI